MISQVHLQLPALLADIDWANSTPLLIGMSAIVVLGLLLGLRDVLRFSPTRIWALSTLAFRESLRRRVLLITPLAIIGVIIVSLFTRPFDEQDAIRQTLKFCMFASGMVVTLVAIMLACTSLPKEVDNRVIYTIVTKPTTRLEIVLGKAVGFGRVSAMVLLIMGLFTWGYLHFTAWQLTQRMKTDLSGNLVPAASRNTIEHHIQNGLLTASGLKFSTSLQSFARPPLDSLRWILGEAQQEIRLPFVYTQDELLNNDPGNAAHTAMYLELDMTAQVLADDIGDVDELTELGIKIPAQPKESGPATPRPSPLARSAIPKIAVTLLTIQNKPLFPAESLSPRGNHFDVATSAQPQILSIFINPDNYAAIYKSEGFVVNVAGANRNVIYGVPMSTDDTKLPARLILVDTRTKQKRILSPRLNGSAQSAVPIAFRGRNGRNGQQIPGADPRQGPAAIYTFNNAVPQGIDNDDQWVNFEIRLGVDYAENARESDDNPTLVQVTPLPSNYFRADQTQIASKPVQFAIDPNRNGYFAIPASAVKSGNFSLMVQCLNSDRAIALHDGSMVMILANHSFAWNLIKSLFILWLLAMLVVCISTCCSTFVSWPIAIVLTVVILFGRWGVQQLGDYDSALANQIANDLFPRGAAKAQVVSTTVGALNKMMYQVAQVLPDISPYGSTDQLEQGQALPANAVLQPLASTALFALPMLVLAFVFLRYKEVAP